MVRHGRMVVNCSEQQGDYSQTAARRPPRQDDRSREETEQPVEHDAPAANRDAGSIAPFRLARAERIASNFIDRRSSGR